MHDETIKILNDLIETCRNGEEGFRTAAEAVKDAEVKTMFAEYSTQRAQFVTELQEQVRKLGGEPASGGTTPGAAHRGWINLRSAITGGDEGAILAEAERGEDVAKETYESAVKKEMTPEAKELVQRQLEQVRQAHDRVRTMRDRRKAA